MCIDRSERANPPYDRVQRAKYRGGALCLRNTDGPPPDLVFSLFEELAGGPLTSWAWRFCTDAEIRMGRDFEGTRMTHYEGL